MNRIKICILVILIFLYLSSNAQKYSELSSVLEKNYPENALTEWYYIFYKDSADINQLNFPLLKKYFPSYEFYAANLTFNKRADWKCRFLIMYDSLSKDLILQAPLAMDRLTEEIKKMIYSLSFNDLSSMFNFINTFHEMRKIGSMYKFIEFSKTDSLLFYHVVRFEDQDYVVKPYRETKDIMYLPKQIMGNTYIRYNENKILEYIELNPTETYGNQHTETGN